MFIYLFLMFLYGGRSSDWNKNLKINFGLLTPIEWHNLEALTPFERQVLEHWHRLEDKFWKRWHRFEDKFWKHWRHLSAKYYELLKHFFNLKLKGDPNLILISVFMVRNLISLIRQKNIFRDRIPLTWFRKRLAITFIVIIFILKMIL